MKIWAGLSNAPRIVVTDQTMLNMTGLDLAGDLLQIRPGIRIILCSGYENEALSSNAKSGDIDLILTKPLLGSDIARAIRRTLGPQA